MALVKSMDHTMAPVHVMRAVTELAENPRNARTHPAAQIDKIAKSIKKFKFLNPCIIDSDGVLIAGHGRLAAAKKLGLHEVPCILADHLTDAEKRAYMLADNRIADDSGWDDAMLKVELSELKSLDFDIDSIGFSEDELEDIFSVKNDGNGKDDEAPCLPERVRSMRGDVFMLGAHRVMCGDSTIDADIGALMDGEGADLVFTDPPYNVDYSGRGQNNLGKIENDSMTDAQFDDFIGKVFRACAKTMKPLACVYVCHPDSQSGPKLAFEKSFADHFKKSSTIIWRKQSAGMGWQDYRCAHEPILYGWKEGKDGKHYFCGDRAKTTVWDIGRDAQITYVHPTQKPVALPLEAINNSSRGNDVVLDLFGGSGSTLIACEKSGRRARLMELDPKYCDVIVNRWQEFTGEKATRESDGTLFDDLETREAA